MHESEALEYLVHDVPYLALWEVPLPPLHDLVKIGLHEFKNKKQLVVLPDYLLELDNIGVVKLLEGLRVRKERQGRRMRD